MNTHLTEVGDRRIARASKWILGGAMAVLVATAFAGLVPVLRARLGWSAGQEGAYALGEVVDLPADLYEGADRTIIVVASATCGACSRSASVLADLAQQVRGSSTRFRLVAPLLRDADQTAFLERLSLRIEESRRLDLARYHVRVIPTVVVVDGQGRVDFLHEGVVGLVEEGRALDVARGHGASRVDSDRGGL